MLNTTSIIIGCLVGTYSVRYANPYTRCRPFRVPPPGPGPHQKFSHVDAAAYILYQVVFEIYMPTYFPLKYVLCTIYQKLLLVHNEHIGMQ